MEVKINVSIGGSDGSIDHPSTAKIEASGDNGELLALLDGFVFALEKLLGSIDELLRKNYYRKR